MERTNNGGVKVNRLNPTLVLLRRDLPAVKRESLCVSFRVGISRNPKPRENWEMVALPKQYWGSTCKAMCDGGFAKAMYDVEEIKLHYSNLLMFSRKDDAMAQPLCLLCTILSSPVKIRTLNSCTRTVLRVGDELMAVFFKCTEITEKILPLTVSRCRFWFASLVCLWRRCATLTSMRCRCRTSTWRSPSRVSRYCEFTDRSCDILILNPVRSKN